jgi:hypothetical protein
MQTVTTDVNAQRIDLKVNGKTAQLEIAVSLLLRDGDAM